MQGGETERMNKMRALLEDKVNPRLRKHGGSVGLCSYADGVLSVRMLGQCANCPAAISENEDLILEELRESVPELLQVQVVSSVSDALLEFARAQLAARRGG